MTTANRGKIAEAKVRAWLLDNEAKDAYFTFNRVYDAHSAGGQFQAQPGDFQAFLSRGGVSSNFVIEVKEIAHSFKLNYSNFERDKVARMRKRELAGSICLVLVRHTDLDIWRMVSFDTFKVRQEGSGSWDLSKFEPTSLAELLRRGIYGG